MFSLFKKPDARSGSGLRRLPAVRCRQIRLEMQPRHHAGAEIVAGVGIVPGGVAIVSIGVEIVPGGARIASGGAEIVPGAERPKRMSGTRRRYRYNRGPMPPEPGSS